MATKAGPVPIEDIKPGDMVWATNPDTGETELKEVVQIFRNETEEWVHVKVNGEDITCTPNHPFYSPVKGWTSAIDLRAGDKLQLLNGEYVVVEQVQHELLESPETTYNFEVEDYHTYYVGDAEVLVHNECSLPEVIRTPEIKNPTQMKVSDAVDAWNDYLGPNQTNLNSFTGKIDADRIFSADGMKSIRFGNHEMCSFGTSKAHFHFEKWLYDASTHTVTYYNRLQRLK